MALWQAKYVQSRLETIGANSEIKVISTQGDRIQHLSFDKMEGKGFFTKEIQEALLSGEIDLAVHSHKDLETVQVPGLHLAAISHREDPSDLLLIHPSAVDTESQWNLKKGAIVGTGSARRKSQFIAYRPDVVLRDLRGNVPTRIGKLRAGEYDAILMANAGVKRLELDLTDLRVVKLKPEEFIPAPAQGVLAIEVREDDKELISFLSPLHHEDVALCVGAERAVLRDFGGGCQIPLGAYCKPDGNDFKLWVAAAEKWSDVPRRIMVQGIDPFGLAAEASAQLKKKSSVNGSGSREI